MHELAITKELVNMILNESKDKVPKKVVVELGDLTSYKKEPILFFFDALKKENKAISNCILDIKEVKGKLICNKCKKLSTIEDSYMMFCPECDSNDIRIIQGKDLKLKEIITK